MTPVNSEIHIINIIVCMYTDVYILFHIYIDISNHKKNCALPVITMASHALEHMMYRYIYHAERLSVPRQETSSTK